MKIKKPESKKFIYKAVIIIAAALLLSIAAFKIFTNESAQLLTKEQAKQAVLKEYSGSVENLTLQSGNYVAELKTGQGLYELELDGATGEIVSIVLLEPAASAEVRPTPLPSSAPPAGGSALPSPSPTAPRAVSEDEAVKLALQEVPGELDDVDTEINESGAFYLVEVNTTDGREAVVQVDAISGNIMSVAWEEPDEDHP
ncbi:PepSY domain-containing protein [Paenibacillus sp. FSL M7-1046]|uniref:PepSY domain-containing protein n=1 Tax=Paenibacillus sp. FSL M7-1046 TaxID=2975315 RepID=UPI0030FA210C